MLPLTSECFFGADHKKEGEMTKSRLLSIAVAFVLIALGETARAAILTAGPAWAPMQFFVYCRLFNTGSTPEIISTAQIWNGDGALLTLMKGDTCGAGRELRQGASCIYSAMVDVVVPNVYTCRAVTNGADDNVSGAMNILGKSGEILVTVPMGK
jgi:hypothetical protein